MKHNWVRVLMLALPVFTLGACSGSTSKAVWHTDDGRLDFDDHNGDDCDDAADAADDDHGVGHRVSLASFAFRYTPCPVPGTRSAPAVGLGAEGSGEFVMASLRIVDYHPARFVRDGVDRKPWSCLGRRVRRVWSAAHMARG